MNIKQLNMQLRRYLKEDSDQTNEFAWKFQDETAKIIDKMISQLNELKNFNEIEKLPELLNYYYLISQDIESVYFDFSSTLDNLEEYIQNNEVEEQKEAIGWLEADLQKLRGILRQNGINEELKKVNEDNRDVITVDEMQQLTNLLQKVLRVGAAAYKDGDFSNSEWQELKSAVHVLDSMYGY